MARPPAFCCGRQWLWLAAGLIALSGLPGWPGAANAQDRARDRAQVSASPPEARTITIYRDPGRAPDQRMEAGWPRGLALITETRRVTLPKGRSTIRMAGVSEGMIAVSAIVSGLPGGTIERNRDAALLSPAALIDGALGNRVRITRTDPATGEETDQEAIVRTRADGGLVVQTAAGFEAVRCAGLPERLSFDEVPRDLGSEPVFSIDAQDETGGTHALTLSYLSWGFDWDAHHVAMLRAGAPGSADDQGRDQGSEARLDLVSWLSVLNGNGQSMPDARLLVAAGKIKVVSDDAGLARRPEARPLMLTCFALGSTAKGSPVPGPGGMAFAPAPAMMMRAEAMAMDGARVVRGARMLATEEDLGDLKLYRVPIRVDVAARGIKQVAFLDREGISAVIHSFTDCEPWRADERPHPARTMLVLRNDRASGLGVALPAGSVSVFVEGPRGPLLLAEPAMADSAAGQEVEWPLGPSAHMQAQCRHITPADRQASGWRRMELRLANAGPDPALVRVRLGLASEWQVRQIEAGVRDGQIEALVTVPANAARTVLWEARMIGG